jgi:hypothetical protein
VLDTVMNGMPNIPSWKRGSYHEYRVPGSRETEDDAELEEDEWVIVRRKNKRTRSSVA